MEFTLKIDVNESDIIEAMDINSLTREETIHRITNNFYMGLSCIDAMLNRDLGIDCTESYVEKLEQKQFVATWGAGYYKQETRNITMADVTEDNGYFPESIYIVEALKVGETADLSDPSGDLTITRVK